MSDISFQNYGKWAETITDPLKATARPPHMRWAEKRIVPDIISKLALQPTDRLLDVGCGVGTLTIPLSFAVSYVTAVDHEKCIERLRQRAPQERIQYVAGDFRSLDLLQNYDKILMYSVIHYLGSIEEVAKFIDSALKSLAPNGRMLVGDIPNDDLKNRYENTPEGQLYARSWNRGYQESINADMNEIEPYLRSNNPDPQLVHFGDGEVLELVAALRTSGYQAWLLPQPPELPMGRWREDLLVCRP